MATVLDQGWADQADIAALPDELLLWGERPDAFVATLKCGALGWQTAARWPPLTIACAMNDSTRDSPEPEDG